MKFLGTGSGDGIPNPFCNCRVCKNARKVKGKEIRMRSSFMLDDEFIIDMGADFFAQSLLYDVCFSNVKHILYTHMHGDHINYSIMCERLVRLNRDNSVLNVYLVDEAYNYITEVYMKSPLSEWTEEFMPNVVLHRLSVGRKYDIGKYKITPLKASHSTSFEKNGSNFLIESNGKNIFYAVDTGYYTDETFEFLTDIKLDGLINECTFPTLDAVVDEKDCHMDIQMCMKVFDKLYNIGTITEDTGIYLSHISSKGMTHNELEEYMSKAGKPYKILVAYDNMNVF